jgi:hypothetical protein
MKKKSSCATCHDERTKKMKKGLKDAWDQATGKKKYVPPKKVHHRGPKWPPPSKPKK